MEAIPFSLAWLRQVCNDEPPLAHAMNLWLRSSNILLAFLILPLVPASRCSPQVTPTTHPPQQSAPTLSALISTLRTRSQSLQSAPGVRRAYDGFLAERHLVPGSVSYSDFVLVRTTFEATRDAGFWNLHWSVTDQPPNSDRIWSQWKTIARPSFTGKNRYRRVRRTLRTFRLSR
jgi:hypothetical protein